MPRRINRRLVLAGLAALPIAATREARVKTLRWQGTAKVILPGRTIDLGVDTSVEPFVRARTDSWLLSDGPGKTRSLIIEPTGGWSERDGTRTPLPPAQIEHERQQFGVYGYMLERGSLVGRGAKGRTYRHVGYPPADLHYRLGELLALDTIVDPPEPGPKIKEHFRFRGALHSNGVRWPRRIEIAQNGVQYFELSIDRFEAVLA